MRFPAANDLKKFQASTQEKFMARLVETFQSISQDIINDPEITSFSVPLYRESEETIQSIVDFLQTKYQYSCSVNRERKEDDPPYVTGYVVLSWSHVDAS